VSIGDEDLYGGLNEVRHEVLPHSLLKLVDYLVEVLQLQILVSRALRVLLVPVPLLLQYLLALSLVLVLYLLQRGLLSRLLVFAHALLLKLVHLLNFFPLLLVVSVPA